MNDNHAEGKQSEIRVESNGGKLTVVFTDQADVDVMERRPGCCVPNPLMPRSKCWMRAVSEDFSAL